MTITCNKETAGMQDEIWHQFGIQNYNGAVLSVHSVVKTLKFMSSKYYIPSPTTGNAEASPITKTVVILLGGARRGAGWILLGAADWGL